VRVGRADRTNGWRSTAMQTTAATPHHEPGLGIQPIHALVVHAMPLAVEQPMHTPMAEPPPLCGQRDHPFPHLSSIRTNG